MIVYNIYFILVILLAVIISCARKKFWLSEDNRIIIDNKLNADALCKLVFCTIIFGYLIFLAANRYDVGFDFFQYALAHEQAASCKTFSELFEIHDGYEPGYVAFEYIISRFSQNYVVFFLAHALLVTGIFAAVSFTFSKSVYISAIVYFVSNIYAISLNFSRQALAIAILFAGFGMLKKKHYFRYSLVILLAISFHYSAAIMFLFVLFCFIKPNKFLYLILFLISLLVVRFLKPILKIIFGVIGDYDKYLDSFYFESVTSKEYFWLFFTLSVIVLFLYFFTSWRKESECADIYVKAALCSAILCICANRYYIFDRISCYFIVWYILIIPDVIQFVFGRLKELFIRLENGVNKNSFKKIFRYKSFYKSLGYVVVVVLIIFRFLVYYNYSVSFGAHKVYPYATLNEKIYNIMNLSKTEHEVLRSEQKLPNYLKLLDNEDYIVVATYYNDWHSIRQFNDVFMKAIYEPASSMGIYDIFQSQISLQKTYGGYILDGGKLVDSFEKGGVSYICYENFIAYADGNERWACVDGYIIEEHQMSQSFLVYSKSEKRIIDYCVANQDELLFSHVLYHYNVDSDYQIDNSKIYSYRDIFMLMFDISNVVVLYNNNEDYQENEVSSSYDKYYSMMGSTITTDDLCNQNVAAMRFGGEWREIIYPSSPAQIEANVDGILYDVYADSYNSYCEINGVEVSSAGTGLNVLIISPEGEILFNGSVDVYSNFNEVTVNDEFAYIPA